MRYRSEGKGKEKRSKTTEIVDAALVTCHTLLYDQQCRFAATCWTCHMTSRHITSNTFTFSCDRGVQLGVTLVAVDEIEDIIAMSCEQMFEASDTTDSRQVRVK